MTLRDHTCRHCSGPVFRGNTPRCVQAGRLFPAATAILASVLTRGGGWGPSAPEASEIFRVGYTPLTPSTLAVDPGGVQAGISL